MKSQNHFLRSLPETLAGQCPFIVFATFKYVEQHGQQIDAGESELFVFVDEAGPGKWNVLAGVLAAVAVSAPELNCGVILLNRADAFTKSRATNGVCLFIRPGSESFFVNFCRRARMDSRILHASGRRLGITDNP